MSGYQELRILLSVQDAKEEIGRKKMKSNWSNLGLVVGVIWSVGFAIRYLFVWQDYSQAILYIGLGLILIGFSWMFDQILRLKNKLTAVEDYLAEENYNG